MTSILVVVGFLVVKEMMTSLEFKGVIRGLLIGESAEILDSCRCLR